MHSLKKMFSQKQEQ